MGAFYGRESKADRTCGRGCACPENHGGADVYEGAHADVLEIICDPGRTLEAVELRATCSEGIIGVAGLTVITPPN